jgi:conjugative transfer region protein TrbK
MAAVGFVILTAVLAIVQSRRGSEAGVIAPLGHKEADALVSELPGCRAVTLDQTVSLETCRRLWAENRRQFFTATRATPTPTKPLPNSATAFGKIQDRLLPDTAEHQHGEVR